jgi:hypothetical protein
MENFSFGFQQQSLAHYVMVVVCRHNGIGAIAFVLVDQFLIFNRRSLFPWADPGFVVGG